MRNDFHAAPAGTSQAPLYDTEVATPTHAERAKTLAATRRIGTLGTHSHDPAGYPYGSLVATTLLDGSPLFLISKLAEHTQNLQRDSRASLLLAEAGDDNPLALGRVTLLGRCEPLGDDSKAARETYLAAHPDAKYYVDYGDFSFFKLTVESLRYIGGFGRMSWVTADAWYAATPDPIAPFAASILEHMNADHKDAMSKYCRAFSKARDFEDVVMTGVDRYGFEMSVRLREGGARPVRLAFSQVVTSSDAVRKEMVALVKTARAALDEG
jgi:heme iron utilization protein